MSRRRKLEKFEEIQDYPNVYENRDASKPGLTYLREPIEMKGLWREKHFKNEGKIILELACGKGEYTLGLARSNPSNNYIGIDVKGARIWRGALTALEEKLSNVVFLRTRAEQLAYFFEEGEVDEIWITFADPFEEEAKENRRLTSPNFLNIFSKIAKDNCLVHLKTDARSLYEYTLAVLAGHESAQLLYHNPDIYSGPLENPALDIKTFYEKQHLKKGLPITYTRFLLK